MITEDYVPFETAKLLKEKGFDGAVQLHYNKIGGMIFSSNPITKNCIKAPTLQMAIKWLKKKHNICIISLPVVTDDDGEAGCLWNYIISRKLEVLHNSECLYESSEIALNDAIKYCLEHLI